MKIESLELCGGIRAAFPFACPWRNERDFPEELPSGSVGLARPASRVNVVRDDGTVEAVERSAGGSSFDDGDGGNWRPLHVQFAADRTRLECGDDGARYAALADVIGDDDPTSD